MCTSPRTIKVDNVDGVRSIQVPCGKCCECLKTKQNDYMIRIYEEMMQVSKSCFVTLTYSDKNVPYLVRDGKKYLTVWKDDVKGWIKRLRTNYERKTGVKGIRYFLCSEYGPKTKRPHYHAIFFGMSFQDLKPALTDWSNRFGFYFAEDVKYTPKDLECSARYVSKYACKGVFENPFRSTVRFSSFFPIIFERSRKELCRSNEIVPFIFSLSSLGEVQYQQDTYFKGWSFIPSRLFGRGLETQVRQDGQVSLPYAEVLCR